MLFRSIEHHAMLYSDLKDPIALLRGDVGAGQLAAYWPYAGNRSAANLSQEAIAPYTALMAASQPMIAQQVLSAYSFRGHRCLLDIGALGQPIGQETAADRNRTRGQPDGTKPFARLVGDRRQIEQHTAQFRRLRRDRRDEGTVAAADIEQAAVVAERKG